MAEKVLTGFIGALIAIILKVIFDYFIKKLEISNIRKIILSDIVHQASTGKIYRQEISKLYKIYKKGLDALNKGQRHDFYEDLRNERFNDCFFSRHTFDTIKKLTYTKSLIILLLLEKSIISTT
ncbi:MAG: hypothetical protein J7604_23450 [Sporocytophaga sp.]|uniref:hypothetical protein n=1 Tax=Sporocytophaga sp. TaxID=2231183 RepID=UPI001B1197A5|nr:hypothetical protein [Sporocytophaga sp.]MBO9703190.1 hypothetical protein [Sporocytophaga sp.]